MGKLWCTNVPERSPNNAHIKLSSPVPSINTETASLGLLLLFRCFLAISGYLPKVRTHAELRNPTHFAQRGVGKVLMYCNVWAHVIRYLSRGKSYVYDETDPYTQLDTKQKMASPSDGRQPQSNENLPSSCQIEQEQRQIETSPRERGGYDCEFVERPKELETDCPICLLVLRDPFQASCCGNSFCQLCINRVQADKKSCPTCNEADFSVFADKRLRRSLYAFRVRCTHQKSGCEWTGELGELERHLNLNPELGRQLVGCAFVEVACTHCPEYFQRRHVHAHESESCPQRPFSCDYCEDYGSVFEDVVNNHWPVCKCYPVSCPNECGVSPERQNVETHVNTVCPLTLVNCDFRYAGCEIQLVRKDMPTHLAESLVTHLSLLALHNQQLTQLTLQQKESLEELKKENEVLKQKVNKDVAREVAELKESLEKSQLKIQELFFFFFFFFFFFVYNNSA